MNVQPKINLGDILVKTIAFDPGFGSIKLYGPNGGLIFQSDHSVPSNVSAENYEYVISLVREYGQYPLKLGEYDIPDLN